MKSASIAAVCVATYRRPDGLRKLLQSLNELALDGLEDVQLKIVVVDNDRTASARAVVEEFSRMRWPLDYTVEPSRGEPYARNAALERAGNADIIAFIDDDECADRQWLAELVETQRRTQADVVFGPVLPRFDVTPPRWLVKSGVFDPLDYPPDSAQHFAYVGNTLVRAALFADARFSERFARLGGVDTHFFMKAHLRGCKIVWSATARVYESIPPSRMRIAWLVRREFRRGNTLSLCLLELEASTWRRLKRTLHAAARIARGSVFILSAVVRGRAALVLGLRESAFGLGLLAGLFNYEYKEYP